MNEILIDKIAKDYAVDVICGLPQCYNEDDFRKFTQSLQDNTERAIKEALITYEEKRYNAMIKEREELLGWDEKSATVNI